MEKKSLELINNIIAGFKHIPDIKSSDFIKILKANKFKLAEQAKKILMSENIEDSGKYDKVRRLVLDFGLKRIKADSLIKKLKPDLIIEHMTFKEKETIEVILEDYFYDQGKCQQYEECVFFKHQEKIIQILRDCINLKKKNQKLNYLKFFSFDPKSNLTDDTILSDIKFRFKTMIWFTYLMIDIIHNDVNACEKDTLYIRDKIQILLNASINDEIYNLNYEISNKDYEGGIWNETLFGYFQGDDERKKNAIKLMKHFNFNNEEKKSEQHLLADHRRCLYKQVKLLFC